MKKTPILILHGWKKRGADYNELAGMLEKEGYTVFAPDMPGFGITKLTKESMFLSDYVTFVKQYLNEKNIKKVIIIGHSFGGRVGAKFTVTYPEMVEKLILTGSPLIKHPLSFKKKIISSLSKIGKQILFFTPAKNSDSARKIIYRMLGEWDYYKSNELSQTFKNVVQEDLSNILSHIHVPTLIIWGEKDTFVPIADAKEIGQKISGALVIVLPNATHKVPYEDPHVFFTEVAKFL